ncbi:MAG TPA: DUF177 domain-containing protein [Polyangia bacterium]
MRYKTKDIGEDGLDVCVAVTGAWLKTECPDLEMRPSEAGISLSGRLELVGEEYLLRGAIRGGLVAQCGRCLEPAKLTLDLPLLLTFTEADEPSDEDEVEEDTVYVEDGVIDLGPALRDELLLNLPMGPLCREDCAGICPTCGANRNLTPCDCAQRPGGGKFSVLAKVKL